MEDQNQQVTSGDETTTTTTREDVQQKYDRLYNSGTQNQNQQGTTVVETNTSTQASVDPNAAMVTQLLEKFNALEARLSTTNTQAAETIVTTPWFEQLRQGEFEGAEADLTNRVQNKVANDVIQKAVERATETMRVQMEIDRYLNDLRGQNPDIAPMERYLRPHVEYRLSQEVSKIKTSQDYIEAYKKAVDAEVTELRKVTGQYRAAGKNEANTRNQQVVNASTLTPQQVALQASQSSQESNPQVTTGDYLNARLAKAQAIRGMG